MPLIAIDLESKSPARQRHECLKLLADLYQGDIRLFQDAKSREWVCGYWWDKLFICKGRGGTVFLATLRAIDAWTMSDYWAMQQAVQAPNCGAISRPVARQ